LFCACFCLRAALQTHPLVGRLLRDRFFALDSLRGCDLATGDAVRMDELPAECPEPEAPPSLIEVLAGARDGVPRWLVAEARNGAQAASITRRAAAEARRRGFVPILVPLLERLGRELDEALEERALLLIGSFPPTLAAARASLIAAAARSARPHVLLTFHGARSELPGGVVREARAAYGSVAVPAKLVPLPMTSEVARHVARAWRAADFQRAGRHAAAERLLREVSATLLRRAARVQAAHTLIALGRLLLERGRATAAEKTLEEAAMLAQGEGDEILMGDARLWQASARIDAGRLTEAESLCRAVLVTGLRAPSREAWAVAVLGRVLFWQRRYEEAQRLTLPSSASAGDDLEPQIAATLDATASRLLIEAGDLFHAGLRARSLLTFVETTPDAITRIVGLTGHLRLLAAVGDLGAAESTLQELVKLARSAHSPLRAARAGLIWHDALQRAGRAREAHRELVRLGRMRPVMPPLLRRAIEQRMAGPQSAYTGPSRQMTGSASREASMAAELIRQTYEEESDITAVRRLLDRLARELQANRVDLVSSEAGPVSTLLTTGAGLPTHLGARVLEAGIVLPAEVQCGGYEIGFPIRSGVAFLAALVCRWPIDREPPPHATATMGLIGAIAAPRVEALLDARREAARASTSIPELVGGSAAMADVRRAIERAARAPFAILIEGESGVGKELAARAIHQLSPRRERRFCDVNCAALPDELLESELFGHARGAFTGAVADKPGLFEDADGGTLFLDEVPDLSARAQAKLLRVIQQNEVRRIGETFVRAIDVRLVTAANRDMRVEAAEQRFRPDLLYRLDVIRIRIPPLRERPEDIAVLAQHFWRAAAARVGSAAVLAHGVLSDLARYPWPGNVRELQNVIAVLAVAAPARGRVRSSLLPAAITGSTSITARRLAEARGQFERRCVEVALARAGGSRTRAAAELGLSRQGLLKTMTRLGIDQKR
jgi:DNA-binding NtrC family response regulator/tetratricopeptide (TPR) repeat protein